MLELLELIANKVGVNTEDLKLKVLKQDTHPEKLADQIEEATNSQNRDVLTNSQTVGKNS